MENWEDALLGFATAAGSGDGDAANPLVQIVGVLDGIN